MSVQREAQVMRLPYRVLGLWMRVALLVVLLWGALVTVLSAAPRERTVADFRAALHAGQVTYVLHRPYQGGPVDLRWSTGPLFWFHAGRSADYTQSDLLRDLAVSESRPEARPVPRREGIVPRWPFEVPVTGAAWIVGGAWVVTLLVMAGTALPRLGNRWAWLWLFTVGEVGAPLFLLLEPRSLWRGLEAQERVPCPLGGGRGFLLAACLGVVVHLSGLLGFPYAVHTVLSLVS